MSERAQEKPVNMITHLGVNLFWLGLNMRNNAVGAIFLPFLVEKFTNPGIQNTALGAIRTAGLIIAMLIQPAAGTLSDRSNFKIGKRRPFLVAGVLLDLLGLLWIASAANYWSLLAAILFFQVSNNISHGPLQSLIPDLIPENQRGTASAIKSIFELLPVALLGITIAPLVASGRFDLAVVATALFLVTALVITLFIVHEKPPCQVEEAKTGQLSSDLLRVAGMLAGIAAGALLGFLGGSLIGGAAYLFSILLGQKEHALPTAIAVGGTMTMVIAVWAGAKVGVQQTLGKHSDSQRRHSFTYWVGNRLAFLAAITSIQGFAPFFLMYAFKISSEEAAGMTGTLFSLVGVCTLASALPAGWLADRFGTVRLTALSGCLACVGTVLLLGTVWQPAIPLIYFAGGVLGLATGLFVTVNWALGTRLVPAAESGRWLGISNLAGAGAGMVGAGIGGPLADQLNFFTPGLGYFTIFTGYAVLFLVSAIFLWPLRNNKSL